jgi:hypothetical protein
MGTLYPGIIDYWLLPIVPKQISDCRLWLRPSFDYRLWKTNGSCPTTTSCVISLSLMCNQLSGEANVLVPIVYLLEFIALLCSPGWRFLLRLSLQRAYCPPSLPGMPVPPSWCDWCFMLRADTDPWCSLASQMSLQPLGRLSSPPCDVCSHFLMLSLSWLQDLILRHVDEGRFSFYSEIFGTLGFKVS